MSNIYAFIMICMLRNVTKIKKNRPDGRFSLFILLVCLEGKKRSNTRPLDRLGELALVLCAGTAHSAGQHFAALGYELAETGYVLIVDNRYLFLAENAYLSAGQLFKALFS